MQILSKENKKYELIPESLDDLWVLSQIIEPEDKIFGKAERKVKIGTENNYKITRKLIYVELKISNTKFENDTLRVTGKILNENEFAPIGSTQSLSYRELEKIEFEKKNILNYHKKLLENSSKTKKSKNLIIILDKDDLIAVEFSSISYSFLFKETGLGSKKYTSENIDEEKQKYLLIEDLLKKDYSNIIFAGPGFFKEKLSVYVREKCNLKISVIQFYDVSQNSIQKLIKQINESGIMSDSLIARENEYTNKLLENINKKIKSSYGYDNIIEKINEGSVEVLMMTTDFIDKKKSENKYEDLNKYMLLIEKLNAELIIINSKNESGNIIDGLGGISAILRY